MFFRQTAAVTAAEVRVFTGETTCCIWILSCLKTKHKK